MPTVHLLTNPLTKVFTWETYLWSSDLVVKYSYIVLLVLKGNQELQFQINIITYMCLTTIFVYLNLTLAVKRNFIKFRIN